MLWQAHRWHAWIQSDSHEAIPAARLSKPIRKPFHFNPFGAAPVGRPWRVDGYLAQEFTGGSVPREEMPARVVLANGDA